MKKIILIWIMLATSALASDSLKFQDATNTIDSWIRSTAATTNYGTAQTGAIYYDGSNTWTYMIELTTVNDSLGAGITVDSARMYMVLQQDAPTDRDMLSYEGWKNSWVETEVTWNIWATGNAWGTVGCENASDGGTWNTGNGSDYDRAATFMDSITVNGTANADTFSIDVSTAISHAYDNAENPMIVLRQHNTAGNSVYTFSMESTVSGTKPWFIIYYSTAGTPGKVFPIIKETP